MQPFSDNIKFQFRSIFHWKRALSATVLLIVVGWCPLSALGTLCVGHRKMFNNATTLMTMEKSNRFTSNLSNQADKVIGFKKGRTLPAAVH